MHEAKREQLTIRFINLRMEFLAKNLMCVRQVILFAFFKFLFSYPVARHRQAPHLHLHMHFTYFICVFVWDLFATNFAPTAFVQNELQYTSSSCFFFHSNNSTASASTVRCMCEWTKEHLRSSRQAGSNMLCIICCNSLQAECILPVSLLCIIPKRLCENRLRNLSKL